MKKQFFIFVVFVFCGLFNTSIFAEPLPAFDKAVYQGDCFEGNYNNVKSLLEKDKSLVTSSSARYKSGEYTYDVPIFAMVINGCCRRANEKACGPNKKSDMAKLFIENGADVNSLVGSPLMAGKEHTLLDFVRYYKTKSGWCPSDSDMTECDKIEQLLIDSGAKTYEDLHGGSSSSAIITEIPVPENLAEAVVPQETSAPLETENAQTKTNASNVVSQAQPQKANQNSTDEQEDLEEKQKAYDDAKETEQSTANKLLGGLSTAATGIGGMQALQGIAEQSADEDAMANMAAYIETMRCTYGDGKQVKAGPEEIELPGANDQELMNLRGQYLALAQDLKERKSALGMKPGIESEEIIDRTQTGLYDDENVGITSGNYESIYRAMMLGSEADQAKLDDAANTSSNRVKYGAIAVGAGVVVGVVGNQLINGKSKDDEEKDEALEKLKKCLKYGGAKKTSDLKFDNFTPSILHLDKIYCSGSAWKDKVKNKDATKLFADTTDEPTIKETLIENFECDIAGKLLDEDLCAQQKVEPEVELEQKIDLQPAAELKPEEEKQPEDAKVEKPEQIKEEKQPEDPKVEKTEQKKEEKKPQPKVKAEQKKQPEEKKKQVEQKKQQEQQPEQKKPQEEHPKLKASVAERKVANNNGVKSQTDISLFKDVQVNLEQGKKIIESWGAKNNKKNFKYISGSEDISTVGQDFILYQDDNRIYKFEFDDLTESIPSTRREGIGRAICLIYKGTPGIGANFVQCNNVKCSDFISAAKQIDSSIKEWNAPNLPYGYRQTNTECRISTGTL